MDKIKNCLISLDTAVFRFINITLYNETAARLMKITANDIFLIILLVGGFYYLYKKNPVKARKNIAFSLWAVIISNVLSNLLLKPLFKRLRPVVEIPDAHMLFKMRKLGFAFPSTHTAMAMALVAALWDDYKEARPYMALFVLFVSFFCVYTGGHYPSDVLAGALAGFVIGKVCRVAMKKVDS